MSTQTKIINCTPHDLHFFLRGTAQYDERKVLREGAVPDVTVPRRDSTGARAATRTEFVGGARYDAADGSYGIPEYRTEYGECEGLPEYCADTLIVVSAITAEAARRGGRTVEDLRTPAELIRDEQGRIVGAAGLALV